MTLPELISELRRRLPEGPGGAPFNTRWSAQLQLHGTPGRPLVRVAARIDAKGRRREQFWCDGRRIDEPLLRRLTCAETECPQARAAREQWATGRPVLGAIGGLGVMAAMAPSARAARARGAQRQPQPQPGAALVEERSLRCNGQSVVARPARFPCWTRCPHEAHPPMQVEKSGWDLFDDGGCVGGGVVVEPDGRRAPRLPTLVAAEAYLQARAWETQAVLALVRR